MVAQGQFAGTVARAVPSHEAARRCSKGAGTEGASWRIAAAYIASPPAGPPRISLAGEPDGAWRDCRVVDISMLGLGITFDHPDPSELSGRLISVNLPGDGSCVNVRLEGEIKNATVTMSRDIRVGIEFIRLSETEQAITAVLSVMSDVLVDT